MTIWIEKTWNDRAEDHVRAIWEESRGVEVNGQHGIYVPQVFAELLRGAGAAIPAGLQEDYEILLKGPDEEHYWEAWETFLDNFTWRLEDRECRFEQDGDLWRVDVKTDQEYAELFEHFSLA